MSDKNSSLINLPDLPDSIDTAVKNLTDKPTQGVGQRYCIIFGAAAQSERLCGRYFCTHFYIF